MPVVTVVVGAATGAYLVLGYPYGPVVLSLVVALVAAVLTGHRLVAWLVAAGVLAAHGVAAVPRPGPRLVVGRRDGDPRLGAARARPRRGGPGARASGR